MTGKNLIGQIFTRLTVLKDSQERTKEGTKLWLCQCNCSKQSIVKVDTSSLNKRHTRSCGCLQRECAVQWGLNRRKHGASKSKYKDGNQQLDYIIWLGINQRCFNDKHKRYKDYGGRGISMYKPWRKDFESFANYIRTLPECPSEKLLKSRLKGKRLKISLDRINNNKNYKPGNLKWSTAKQQNSNKRNNLIFTYKGKKMILSKIVELYGNKPYSIVRQRIIRDGWSLEEALQ